MTSTFILGIDGGTWRILDEYDLPAFDRLIEGGASGTLRSTYPPITFPAWKCLSTGKNPGKLGVFGFSNFDREAGENRQNDATHFDSAELWDYVSDEGGRVGVVNMPTTFPPHDVNGVMIAGPNAGDSGYVTPSERESEIEEMGYQPLTSGHRLAFKAGGEKAVSAAEEIIESRFSVSRQLLQEEEFDLFDLTLYCTDTIQHYYWMEEELREVYEIVDRELGVLLNQLEADEEEWNVVVVSDHGFQPIEGAFYMDSWLEQEGFLVRDEDSGGERSLRRSLGLTTGNAYRIIERLGLEGVVGQLPDSLVKRAGNELAGGGGVAVVDAVDWAQSDAVFLHGGLFVLDEDRRVEIIEEMETAFETFTDERGERVIETVHRGEEVYDGEHTGVGPDVVPIAPDYKLLGFSGDGALFDPEDDWIAGHEMEGVFIGSGPYFGDRSEVELSLYDVVPTVLHGLGAAVPTDIDGTVQRKFMSGVVGDADTETRDPLPPRPEDELGESDKERMNERLKQLGYME
jgi:predicted AlkP superfamily phosphohydrolase/phosphomutase